VDWESEGCYQRTFDREYVMAAGSAEDWESEDLD
jgi:hypothetical protein